MGIGEDRHAPGAKPPCQPRRGLEQSPAGAAAHRQQIDEHHAELAVRFDLSHAEGKSYTLCDKDAASGDIGLAHRKHGQA